MNKLIIPSKFRKVYKIFKKKKFYVLDIGCGNHSPSHTKFWFPDCLYYGLDKDLNYNNDTQDIKLMDTFYQIDLETSNLQEIPDEHFDLILMTHVIEHLAKGDKVIIELLKKLKPDGYFYIEYPSFKSVKFPSMKGTLNFFDDPTHIRLYSQIELFNLFLQNNCKIVSGGVKRNWLYVMLTPAWAMWSLLKYKHVKASILWDLFGFAEYVLIQKK